jgi:serine/threonine protein kinase
MQKVMTPERYQRIGQLYLEALDLEPDKRAGYLSEACADDEDLYLQVEALLLAHQEAKDFLAEPIVKISAGSLPDTSIGNMERRELGVYQLIKLLGTGGMGEVYLARDTRLGRNLALKLLPAAYTRDADRVRRFKQEARAASALNHPNIITIYDIGEIEGTHYIAAEFIDGQTLRQQLLRSARPVREVLDVAIQIASALATAHEAGIAHRDIKPENVMLRRDGYVKVLDFGLAKLTETCTTMQSIGRENAASIQSQIHTDPGIVLGTAAYLSPEQAQGRETDSRSDLFSFGVLLYEMLTGIRPFDRESRAATITAIIHNEAPPLARYLRNASAELERIVEKTLAKDPEERYQLAKDLLIDLKNLKLEIEIESRLKRASRKSAKLANATDDQMVDGPAGIHPTGATVSLPVSQSNAFLEMLEPVGGAVPLDSVFYVVRPTDEKFYAAIARQDSIVLIKGARQTGKTSLLARGLQQARESGAAIVLTDLQSLGSECLESSEKLMFAFANAFSDQLNPNISPDQIWKPNRSPGINFEQYLRREVILKSPSPVVWGLDEVDRLFTCSFGSEIFGLFRSWHNKRALDPMGPWQRLTLAIAYATEAHLFITDLNQSPFNVGTRLLIEDFTFEQVADLNERYNSPLRDKAEIARYYRLVGGHPYLARRGLHEMVTNGLELSDIEAKAESDEGPFGDHLHRMLISLRKDRELCEIMRDILQGKPCLSVEGFYRLRGAGLATGESTRDIRPRCQLYATYLERHLLL